MSFSSKRESSKCFGGNFVIPAQEGIQCIACGCDNGSAPLFNIAVIPPGSRSKSGMTNVSYTVFPLFPLMTLLKACHFR